MLGAARPLRFNFVFHKLSDWGWIRANAGYLLSLCGRHLVLAIVPVVIALAVAIPLGALCSQHQRAYGPLLAFSTLLYALPSLAAFVILLQFTAFSDWTVMIPLATYALAILLRSVTDGLRSVPDETRLAATAMGFGPLRRLLTVELRAATPVIVGGLRLATVSSISLVSVGALIGKGALGQLFIAGEQSNFPTEIWCGIVLVVALALLCDGLLILGGWLATPWNRGRR